MTKYNGIELLRELCLVFGPTGCEDGVADFIKAQIDGVCDKAHTDRLGNLLALIGSGDSKRQRIMISAHMDEVGFMVNQVTEDGYLKFGTVGGIDPSVLSGKNVTIGDEVSRIAGVIMSKAIHHKSPSEREEVTPIKSMYIDAGFENREEALKYVDIGTYATFDSEFVEFGKDGRKLKCKAIDDRLGCAVMIEVMRRIYPVRDTLPFDIYFCFTVREEIGISGAQVAAQTILPSHAIVLETTAIADIADTPDNSKVALQGEGGVISLMDRSTIYDRTFVDFALDVASKHGIKTQIKKYISGGNDAGHIHKSGAGIRTLALSAPVRYLHSPACVVDKEDYFSMIEHVHAMITDWQFTE